jgi:adenine C2-methylase RlmN of 23S rRNA A2503 and tRNA A37
VRGGVSNSVRAERGDDIDAACGQLSPHERRKQATSPDATLTTTA